MLTGKIKNIFLKSSVATISTALFKRGLRNQFIQGVSPLNPNLSNMIGSNIFNNSTRVQLKNLK